MAWEMVIMQSFYRHVADLYLLILGGDILTKHSHYNIENTRLSSNPIPADSRF